MLEYKKFNKSKKFILKYSFEYFFIWKNMNLMLK